MPSRIPSAWAAVIVSLVFVIGCTENPVTNTEQELDYNPPPYDYIVPDLSEDIVLGYGQMVYIESENMTVRFSDVIGDSRCPEGVQCFWEGQAVLEFEFAKPGGEDDVVIAAIGPGRDPLKEPDAYACCLGYRLYVLALDPYPVYGKEIDLDEYVALIRIVADPEGCDDGSILFTWISPGFLQLDPVTVTEASIAFDDLTIGARFSGGCLEHDFKLFMQPVFLESSPLHANLYLVHNAHGDACRAIVHEWVTFDIRDIAELYYGLYGGYDDIILNIYGYFEDRPEEGVTVVYSPE